MRRQGTKETPSISADSPIGRARRRDFDHIPPIVIEIEGEAVEFANYPEIARQFAERVVNQEIIYNRRATAACKRYLKMLRMASKPRNEFYFDPLHPIDYCAFLEKLEHAESGSWETNQRRPDGTVDKRIILEPWQIFSECAIHGFRRIGTGHRLVTRAYEEVPRKHAKSLRVAGAALYDLCCSGQLGAQTIIGAASREQAGRVFKPISRMAMQSRDLVERFRLKVTSEYVRSELPSGGEVAIISSLSERNDGWNPSLAILEEMHAQGSALYDVVRSAFGARPNALMRMITTAGTQCSGSAWDLRQEMCMILDGKHEDYSVFALIFEIDRADLYAADGKVNFDRVLSDERIWWKCNPMLGTAFSIETFRELAKEARVSPKKRSEFLRTRLNAWVNSGESLVVPDQWDACYAPGVSVANFFGKRCWIGVDLASKADMCAIAIVFEVDWMPETIAVFARYFLPKESQTVHNPEISGAIFDWSQSDHLMLTEGAMADFGAIEEEINVCRELFDVQCIAFDPYQANDISYRLWMDGAPVATFRNSAQNVTGPTDDLLTRVTAKKLIHDGNPILAWNASNVHGTRKGNGSIVPKKESDSSPRKIDGFVAAVYANGVRMNPDLRKNIPKTQAPSPYEKRALGIDDRDIND